MIKLFPSNSRFSPRLWRSLTLTWFSVLLGAQVLRAGCDLVVTVSVLVNYNGEDVSCVGSCNGVVIANVSGGIPPYTYLWEDGQSNQVAIGMCSGTHTVMVTDATGTCTESGSITLNDPAALVVTATAFTFPGGLNISCPGESDGQVTASASGGVGGYSYFWSDGQLGPAAVDVPAGALFVQVTDANGCTDLDTAFMQEPLPLSAVGSVVLPVSCTGRNDGSIAVSMSGGNGGFTYLWTGGATGPVRSGLSPGTYPVSVTDALGCTFDTSFSITTAPPLQAALAGILPESCEGYQDGAIDIQVSGGSMPYTYRWSNGMNTQDITGIGANEYFLTVRDSRGCTATVPATVEQSSRLQVSALQVNPACNENNGGIHLILSGADGAAAFLWSDGQTSASAVGLPAGTYDVAIMDAACMISRSFLLDNTTTLETDIENTLSACNAPTGTATAMVSGGTAPYSWLWSDGQTTQTATALAQGTYTVRTQDAAGCQTYRQAIIRQLDDLELSADITPASVCNGNTATASLSPAGGTPPYTYLWSSGATTSGVTGLRSGVYTARVTDFNLCTDTIQVNIGSPVFTLIGNGFPALCGAASGAATLDVSGGTTPYRYRWSSGDTTAGISGLSPGAFWVQVRDENGCAGNERVLVSGSPGVLVEADVQGISCTSLEDGVISLNVLRGIPDFTIAWSDGPTTAIRTGLSPGEYSVEIQDEANCIAAGPIPLGDGCDLPLDAVNDFALAVEGATQAIEVLLNDSYPDREDIFITLVSEPLFGSAVLGPDDIFQYTAPANFTGPDSFSYVLCNGFGLCDTAWVILTVVPEFQIPDAFSPNGDGVNDFFDIRGIDEYPDNLVVIVNRWGTEVFRSKGYTGGWPGTTENGTALPVGTYYYRIELGDGMEPLGGFVVINR